MVPGLLAADWAYPCGVLMVQPENNAIAIDTLARILPMSKHVDCLIYDKMCKLQPVASAHKILQQVK